MAGVGPDLIRTASYHVGVLWRDVFSELHNDGDGSLGMVVGEELLRLAQVVPLK